MEDSKTQLAHQNRYGNIYANVLSNASRLLKANGVMGFVIPLSYISTPRMKKIREELLKNLPQQYILNAQLSILLLNSSLFWWYWVCVSDCWHITNKELTGFRVPESFAHEKFTKLMITSINCTN